MSDADLESRIIKAVTEGLEGVLAIYRFGSAGTPYERPASDLDLAVLTHAPSPPPRDTWLLAQRLATQLGREVDLIDLGRASTVMRAQIVANGRRIHCAERATCEAFEDRVYSAYALLNEERREILKSIAERGAVYGRRR